MIQRCSKNVCGHFGVCGNVQRCRVPFVWCHVEQFLGGGSCEYPQENKVDGFCFCSRMYYEGKVTNANILSFEKKDGPRKPEVFYVRFDLYHLNQAGRLLEAEHYLC